MAESDYEEIAYIAKTHGLKGDVQMVFSYHAPEKLKLKSVYVEMGGKMIPFFVSRYKLSQKDMAYVAFEDLDHIDKVQPLAKKKVFLPKRLMPKIKKEEFTMFDLKGFSISDLAYGDLGQIAEVREFPQQFLATVNFREKEVLIPLAENLIKGIDVKNKHMEMELPEGLLDIYLEQ